MVTAGCPRCNVFDPAIGRFISLVPDAKGGDRRIRSRRDDAGREGGVIGETTKGSDQCWTTGRPVSNI